MKETTMNTKEFAYKLLGTIDTATISKYTGIKDGQKLIEMQNEIQNLLVQ